MKAAYLESALQVHTRDVPQTPGIYGTQEQLPNPGPDLSGEVLIRIRSVGVCASDRYW